MSRRLQAQTGVVLVVALFMLAILTVIGISAVHLSTTHFRLVGNLQDTLELEMATRAALEQYASERYHLICDNRAVTMQVQGREVCIAITTRCTGVTRGDPEGGSLVDGKQALDSHWELTGTPVDADANAGIRIHLGVLVPVWPHCPDCTTPTSLPSCQPAPK